LIRVVREPNEPIDAARESDGGLLQNRDLFGRRQSPARQDQNTALLSLVRQIEPPWRERWNRYGWDCDTSLGLIAHKLCRFPFRRANAGSISLGKHAIWSDLLDPCLIVGQNVPSNKAFGRGCFRQVPQIGVVRKFFNFFKSFSLRHLSMRHVAFQALWSGACDFAESIERTIESHEYRLNLTTDGPGRSR